VRVRHVSAAVLLAFAAVPAAARDARATFTVGVRVVRSAQVAADDVVERGGAVRVRAGVGARAMASPGVTVSGADAGGAAVVRAAPPSGDVALPAPRGASVAVVTVLPDGAPPAIRFVR
jgi:hypothetical protein